MSLTGPTFAFSHKGYRMLLSVTLNSGATASQAGDTITEPWKLGNGLAVLLGVTAIAASSGLTVKVQGQKRSDASWVNIPQHSSHGVADLAFPASKLLDGGELETNKVLVGTIDLNRFDSDTYKALRLIAANSAATDATVFAMGVIFDAPRNPIGQTDDLLALQRPLKSATTQTPTGPA